MDILTGIKENFRMRRLLKEAAEQIPRLERPVAKYLAERNVTDEDVLLDVHPLMTPFISLRKESAKHISRICALNLAFGRMGGRIYELRSEVNFPLQKFLSMAGMDIEMVRVFLTDDYRPIPKEGRKALIAEMKKAVPGKGRVLVAGSYLLDGGNGDLDDIPEGCVAGIWGEIKYDMPAYILRSFCFGYGANPPYLVFKKDAKTSLKPWKNYQGCI